MTVTTADVAAAALNGVTINDNYGSSSSIYVVPGRTKGLQADGTYLAPAVDYDNEGIVTLHLVPGFTDLLTFKSGGVPFYARVEAFTGTQVYLAATNATGQPLGSNAWLISNVEYPLPSSFPVTLYTTGSSYTTPNGVTITGMPCFARGTLIATPGGDVPVEELREGDLVLTVSGRARSLIWTGSRAVSVARHPQPEKVRPVRILAGAFSAAVPSRDLIVSPDHNVFVDGVLIPAKCLVNNRNVALHDVETVEYHHIELDGHDVVYANGLETETYLDTGNRASFAGEGVVAAHPDFSSAPDRNYFAWEASGYARIVLAGPELDRVRARLIHRARENALPKIDERRRA